MSAGVNALDDFRRLLQGEVLPNVNNPQAVDFAVYILGTFGLAHAVSIESGLAPTNLKEKFRDVWRSFIEIQNAFKGVNRDTELLVLQNELPKTNELVNGNCPASMNKADYFNWFKKRSFHILTFLEEAYFYPNLSTDLISEVEFVRRKALPLIMDRLTPQEECKETENNTPLEGTYFNYGAVIWGGVKFPLFTLARSWGEQTRNTQLVEEVESQFPIRHWISGSGSLFSFQEIKAPCLFRDYFIQISVATVMGNLEIKSPFLQETLLRAFQNEELRSGICCFTANRSSLFEIDLSNFNRPATPLLRALQRFVFIDKSYQLDTHEVLLKLLIKNIDQESELPGFKNRNWDRNVTDEERAAFIQTWGAMRSMLKPKESGDEFLNNPHCWVLFIFLWKSDNRVAYATLFSKLAEHFDNGDSIPIELFMQFCEINGGAITERVVESFCRHCLDNLPKTADANSYQNCLTELSLNALQTNLRIKFSQALKEIFIAEFRNLAVAGEVCRLTADLPTFYKTDFTGRASTKLLTCLQHFLFIVQKYGVHPKRNPALLEMLLRNEDWKHELPLNS